MEYTPAQLKDVECIQKCKTPYEMLGVTKDTNVEDIGKAFRKLSLKIHPDKNKAPGSEEAFKALSNARTSLINMRELYEAANEQHPAPAPNADSTPGPAPAPEPTSAPGPDPAPGAAPAPEPASARSNSETEFSSEDLFNFLFRGNFPNQSAFGASPDPAFARYGFGTGLSTEEILRIWLLSNILNHECSSDIVRKMILLMALQNSSAPNINTLYTLLLFM
uniref:DnaJ homolog subfamily B member 14 n=1 Tax=Culex pipiens TaxID=7175 RepID=A0A8D8FMR7_CULPI